jgi:hypothetical protein
MTREGAGSIPADAQAWIDLYFLVGGYTTPALSLNGPRWYGWNIDALIEDLNTAYFINANYQLFIDGSASSYPPKSGHLDIFIGSPRPEGFNSLGERPKKRR